MGHANETPPAGPAFFNTLYHLADAGDDAAFVAFLDLPAQSRAGLSREIDRPPLHWAALLGRPEACRAIIERGCDVDLRQGRNNGTALLLACQSGAANSVSLLLAAGADPLAMDDRGDTPARVAISLGGPTARAMLAGLRKRGLPATPDNLGDCGHKTLAMAAVRLMTKDGLAVAAASDGDWTGLAGEELAKREAAELRKAAKRPKPKAAKAGGRL